MCSAIHVYITDSVLKRLHLFQKCYRENMLKLCEVEYSLLLLWEMLTFALCVKQDVLFKRGVSGVGEGLC